MRTTEPVTVEAMPAFAPEYRRAVRFSLVLQLPILLVAALMLDGGRSLNSVAIAITVYWLATLVIICRRRSAPTTADVAFIRYGVVALAAAAHAIAPGVWHFIGKSTRSGWERLWNG